MRVNNNTISSPSQPLFGSRVRQKENIRTNNISGAYKVDISNWAMNLLSEYEDDVPIFNSNVLNYSKDLNLTYKRNH